jgi:ketosteroid isomerase-like protein
MDSERFAADWYAAWDAHDLDAIVAHYDEDVSFTSPFVVRLTGDPSGRLEGRDAVRSYFARALERYPDLRFEPLALMTGVDSVVLHYISVEGLLAAELMTLAADGRVTAVVAHYGRPA